MLIDTHCHLTDKKLSEQVGVILQNAAAKGVEKILVPSTGILDAKRAIELANKYDRVWAMVGVHPEILTDETNPEYRDEWLASGGDWIGKENELLGTSKRIVGIGEIGLDFHFDKEKRSQEIQMRLFQEQMELALKLRKPAVIHMREAESEMKQVIEQMKELPTGQFHCWAGSEEFLRLVLGKGFYVSFCGNITYKSADSLRKLIKTVPLDRLLLETDSPYLAPEGFRKSPNEPANVKIIAEYIARILEIPTDTLINQTTQNALCLYFDA